MNAYAMYKNLQLLTVLAILFFSCAKDQMYVTSSNDYQLENLLNQHGGKDNFILPDSDNYGLIPQDPHNPLTAGKVELGKLLFHETGLGLSPMHAAGEGTYSCSSCHIASAGFRPGRPQGIADGGIGFGDNGEGRVMNNNYAEDEPDVQGVRPLSVLNVAFVTNTTWNGRFGGGGSNVGTEALWTEESGLDVNHLGFKGLESQNIEGLKLHRMVINKEVLDDMGYTPLFDACFDDVAEEERYSFQSASFAISAYLRTLLTNEAPFQEWLKGNKAAMTEQEKRGANLFFGKANCSTCHRGSSLNGDNFYAIGVEDLYKTGAINTSRDDIKNWGRGEFTGRAEDRYKFKVPQLYNLEDSPHYFHGASKTSLEEVVEYFNNATPENEDVPPIQISPGFKPLNLTGQEKRDLVAFLKNALRDPNLDRYVPDSVLSGNCFPNNDVFSQNDLGCE
jgi:cytochrome c peroxidase